MGTTPKSDDQTWTYADYYTWDDGVRCELIDGKIQRYITPSYFSVHQKVLGALAVQIANYMHVTGRRHEVYMAPLDVRLPSAGQIRDDEISTVVIPDIIVVCVKTKLDDRGCVGAPDLVVEVLSPDTAAYDLGAKFRLYERAGVRELWLVDPDYEYAMIFRLGDDGAYGRHEIFGRHDLVNVPLIGDLVIDLAKVFGD